MTVPKTRLDFVPVDEVGVSRSEWDRLARDSDTATLFHEWGWFHAMCRAFGRRAVPLAIVDGRGEPRGILPVAVGRFGPIVTIESPIGSGTPYGAPGCSAEDFSMAMAVLPRLRSAIRYDYVSLAASPWSPPLGAAPSGFEFDNGATVLLPLDGTESDLWKGLKPPCRRKVQSAKKAGLHVQATDLPVVLDNLIEWSDDAYRRRGKHSPIPRTFFEYLWEDLHDKALRLFAVYDGDRAVAVSLVAWDRSRMYSIVSHFDREARAPGASNLAWWESIRWGASKGLEVFDMVGANIPSIAEFKLSFGGQRSRTLTARWTNRRFRMANRVRRVLWSS